jgi:hypothetical protein
MTSKLYSCTSLGKRADLARYNFLLFALLKDALRDAFCGLEAETQCVKSWNASAKIFMRMTESISHKGGKSLLIMGNTWENNINFLKDLPIIYVNFIIDVTMASEKK